MDDSRPGGAAATAGAEATDSADRLRLERRSPFSYACQACSRCCHDIRIQLNSPSCAMAFWSVACFVSFAE